VHDPIGGAIGLYNTARMRVQVTGRDSRSCSGLAGLTHTLKTAGEVTAPSGIPGVFGLRNRSNSGQIVGNKPSLPLYCMNQ
jgi:hypothetical protein